MTANLEQPMETKEPRTYTLIQLAELTGLSYRTTADLAARGEFPGMIRFGRRVMFKREAIDQMLRFVERGDSQQVA